MIRGPNRVIWKQDEEHLSNKGGHTPRREHEIKLKVRKRIDKIYTDYSFSDHNSCKNIWGIWETRNIMENGVLSKIICVHGIGPKNLGKKMTNWKFTEDDFLSTWHSISNRDTSLSKRFAVTWAPIKSYQYEYKKSRWIQIHRLI